MGSGQLDVDASVLVEASFQFQETDPWLDAMCLFNAFQQIPQEINVQGTSVAGHFHGAFLF